MKNLSLVSGEKTALAASTEPRCVNCLLESLGCDFKLSAALDLRGVYIRWI